MPERLYIRRRCCFYIILLIFLFWRIQNIRIYDPSKISFCGTLQILIPTKIINYFFLFPTLYSFAISLRSSHSLFPRLLFFHYSIPHIFSISQLIANLSLFLMKYLLSPDLSPPSTLIYLFIISPSSIVKYYPYSAAVVTSKFE